MSDPFEQRRRKPGTTGDDLPAGEAVPWRLRDHIGRLSGIVLGLFALGILVVIAAAGDPSALGILVVIVTGVVLIYLGGQLHKGGRR